MRNEKRRILIWLPVILLLLANVILAIVNSANLTIAIRYTIGAIETGQGTVLRPFFIDKQGTDGLK